MQTAIQISHLFKSIKHHRKEIFSLRDITLEVPQGDFFALLGPNGSGKTTLINCILGLLQPDAGQVKIFGKEPLEKDALLHINFLLTDQEEPWLLRVKDILHFYADLYNIAQQKKKIAELAELLNLTAKMDQPLYRLSSGEKTRVMVARALINHPKLLILDEPTHNLDTYTAEKLRHFLLELNTQGTTILFTSHNMQEIERLAKSVAFIKNGQITDSTTLENIRRKHKNLKNYLQRNNR